MGFPNKGAQAAAAHLAQQAALPILGINIGKTASVSLELAAEDYRTSFECLYPYARYFAINVSSPNTVGLRELQAREALEGLSAYLDELQCRTGALRNEQPKPLLVKIAPDLEEAAGRPAQPVPGASGGWLDCGEHDDFSGRAEDAGTARP